MSTTADKTCAPAAELTFLGYARSGGRVGVRNHLAMVSTVALSNRIGELASERHETETGETVLQIKGEFQRGLQKSDAQLQDQVLAQIVEHPNIGGALVLCHDRRAAAAWKERLAQADKPVEVLAVMGSQGVQRAIDLATLALARLGQQVRGQIRVPCRFSALTFALECGGSDASSAVCSNPAVGRFVDWAIAQGATVIVSETAEFIGGEDVVRAQSASPEIARAIIDCIAVTETRMAGDGDNYRGVNPTAENIEGGLTTLVEKTMGAVCKIGGARFVGCLSFGQVPDSPGLYFMDTPFFSPCSITGMVAAGAQITLFSMGVFNPSGNPLAPTIKVCGNPQTLRDWGDGIDVGLDRLIAGEITLEDAGQELIQEVMRVAVGKVTRTEVWGEGQFIVPRMLPTF
ncbi:MAG: hydro-lyase [Betaproteobacteria bacterium]|nr:hydro-lyase [Betaproteobacteria bacterium]NBQ79544.1 hydro-lyase [Betaproteobacteria bacterium]NBT05466.1 hydro-lyase [Betaproteobacteria bacterium]